MYVQHTTMLPQHRVQQSSIEVVGKFTRTMYTARVIIILVASLSSLSAAHVCRRRTKKSRAGVGKDFSEFLLVIGAIMTCVIAPVFFFFLHSIYKVRSLPVDAGNLHSRSNQHRIDVDGRPAHVQTTKIDTARFFTYCMYTCDRVQMSIKMRRHQRHI